MAQDSASWIVIADARASIVTNLAILNDGSGRMLFGLRATQTINSRKPALPDPALERPLQHTIRTAHHRCGGYTVHPTQKAAVMEAQNPRCEPEAVDPLENAPRSIDQPTVVRPLSIVLTGRRLLSQSKDFGVWKPDIISQTRVKSRRASRNASESLTLTGTLTRPALRLFRKRCAYSSLAAFRPECTLQSIAYAAEEVGLRGSTDIAREPRLKCDHCVAGGYNGYAGSSKDMYLVSDYVSTNSTALPKNLVPNVVVRMGKTTAQTRRVDDK